LENLVNCHYEVISSVVVRRGNLTIMYEIAALLSVARNDKQAVIARALARSNLTIRQGRHCERSEAILH